MILKWHSSHLILNTSLCSRLNCFPSGFLLFVPPLPLKLNPWSYSWSRDSYYLFFVFPWDFSASKTYLYLKREMSEPKDIPSSPSHHHASFTDGSPLMSSLLPNPIITKRTRTLSMSVITSLFWVPQPLNFVFYETSSRLELALEHPVEHGVIKAFCRVKGHGFIRRDNGEDIFVHVSE